MLKKKAVVASIGFIEQTLLDPHLSGSVCVGRHIVKSSRLLPNRPFFAQERWYLSFFFLQEDGTYP